jgi:hypothetical protein
VDGVEAGGVCFSPAALYLLGAIWVVIQALVVYLFRGWMGSLNAQISNCQATIIKIEAERDRALDGWEATVGLGEKAVRRVDRRRAP